MIKKYDLNFRDKNLQNFLYWSIKYFNSNENNSWFSERYNSLGIMINLSGGADSLAALLICYAMRIPVSCLIQPTKFNKPESTKNAEEICKLLSVPFETVNIQPVLDILTDENDSPTIVGNVAARIRMINARRYCNKYNYLLGGTGNASEIFLGYFTKSGDGDCDIDILGTTIKEDVYNTIKFIYEIFLIKHPESKEIKVVIDEIMKNKPSAELWENQTDEAELGFPWSVVDDYIMSDEFSFTTKYSRELYDKITNINKRTEHKRKKPEVLLSDNLDRTKKQTNILCLIDLQKGFSELCPSELPVNGAKDLTKDIYDFLEKNKFFDLCVATVDNHPSDHISFNTEERRDINIAKFPPHCISGTYGQEIIDENLQNKYINKVFEKGLDRDIEEFSAFNGKTEKSSKNIKSLIDFLVYTGIVDVTGTKLLCPLNIYVCGLVLEYCVVSNYKDITTLLSQLENADKYLNVYISDSWTLHLDDEKKKEILNDPALKFKDFSTRNFIEKEL